MNLVAANRSPLEHIKLISKWYNITKVSIPDSLNYLRQRVHYYENAPSRKPEHYDDIESCNHTSLKVLYYANYSIESIYNVVYQTDAIALYEFAHAVFSVKNYQSVKQVDVHQLVQA